MKFFFDNNLSKNLVKGFKAFGEDVVHIKDIFPEGTPDIEWLKYVGVNRLILVTRDERLRFNPAEIISAVKRAVPKLYPTVHNRLVDTSIIVNNILDNTDFQNPRTVLNFDGDNDLVTVTDNATIDDIFGTGGTAEWKDTVFSDGENDLGFVLNKVQWSAGYRDELNGYVRMEFTVIHDSTTGVWMTADRCRKLGTPQVSSLRHNTDDLVNDPEYFLDGIRQVLIPTTTPSGVLATGYDYGDDAVIGVEIFQVYDLTTVG